MKYKMISILSIISFIALWQSIVYLEIFPKYLLAGPVEIFNMLVLSTFESTSIKVGIRPWPEHVFMSIIRAMTGFIVAAIIGIPLGILMGWYKSIEALVDPIFELIRPIPPIAWIPLAILWFGIGLASKVFIIWLGAFIPCLINSYIGVKTVDPILIRAARTLGASDRQIFLTVAIPYALPTIIGGLRIAVGSAWMCLVAAELIGADIGLGFLSMHGMQWLRPDITILAMMLIGVLGFFFDTIIRKIEGKFSEWRK
ncbi:MAG: ABC transporter permease [Candidatus Methanomethylicaceae archaeon]